MLKSLRQLLESLVPPAAYDSPEAIERSLRLATAVMLVEVMRADATVAPEERLAVHRALQEKFSLGPEEAAALADLAETTARDATDLFSFTSRIDERFDMAAKVRMIENMWRVAYADGRLTEHERHVLWRIADLLHVPQGAYVNARIRAEQEAAASGG